jgi:hypothetical protein
MMRVFILAKVMQAMRDQLLPIQGIKNLEWDQKHICGKVDQNLINNNK